MKSATPLNQPSNPTDVVAEYVAAEGLWREVSADLRVPTRPQVVRAAMTYADALDAYIRALKTIGRQIPHHLDDVAASLRAEFGDEPLPDAA